MAEDGRGGGHCRQEAPFGRGIGEAAQALRFRPQRPAIGAKPRRRLAQRREVEVEEPAPQPRLCRASHRLAQRLRAGFDGGGDPGDIGRRKPAQPARLPPPERRRAGLVIRGAGAEDDVVEQDGGGDAARGARRGRRAAAPEATMPLPEQRQMPEAVIAAPGLRQMPAQQRLDCPGQGERREQGGGAARQMSMRQHSCCDTIIKGGGSRGRSPKPIPCPPRCAPSHNVMDALPVNDHSTVRNSGSGTTACPARPRPPARPSRKG